MASQNKQDQVDNLVELIKQTPNFALIKFDKTTHTSLEKLRHELKKTDSQFRVIKNTLFEKAIGRIAKEEKGLKELEKSTFPLKESTAVLSLKGDFVAGLGSFFKFSQTEKSLSFKAGYIEHQTYQEDKLTQLAKLPPKEQLLAKLIGSFQSPARRMVYSMKYNVSKLAYVLSQRGKQA